MWRDIRSHEYCFMLQSTPDEVRIFPKKDSRNMLPTAIVFLCYSKTTKHLELGSVVGRYICLENKAGAELCQALNS